MPVSEHLRSSESTYRVVGRQRAEDTEGEDEQGGGGEAPAAAQAVCDGAPGADAEHRAQKHRAGQHRLLARR